MHFQKSSLVTYRINYHIQYLCTKISVKKLTIHFRKCRNAIKNMKTCKTPQFSYLVHNQCFRFQNFQKHWSCTVSKTCATVLYQICPCQRSLIALKRRFKPFLQRHICSNSWNVQFENFVYVLDQIGKISSMTSTSFSVKGV